jgi:hypothetical protein
MRPHEPPSLSTRADEATRPYESDRNGIGCGDTLQARTDLTVAVRRKAAHAVAGVRQQTGSKQ